jgi:hypothetical protein
MRTPYFLARDCVGLYFGGTATETEMVMSNDVRDEHLTDAREPELRETDESPLRHFRLGRRVMLQSLATGVGVAVFAARASAQHDHHAAVAAAVSTAPVNTTDSGLLFFDQHAFDTLALLGEQIVPGSREARVAAFLDRLLAVESTDTQKRVIQVLGAFEREARAVHGKPWKSLSETEASALLTQISTRPDSDPMRQAFDGVKGAVAQTYYDSEVGMKELGWNGGIAFAPPVACG